MLDRFGEDKDLALQRSLDLILERSDRNMKLGYGVLGFGKDVTEDYVRIFEVSVLNEKSTIKHIWLEKTPKKNYFLNATIKGHKFPARHLGNKLKEAEILELLVDVIQEFNLEFEVAAHLYLRLPKSASKKLTSYFESIARIEIIPSLAAKLGGLLLKANSDFRNHAYLLANVNKEKQGVWLAKLTSMISK